MANSRHPAPVLLYDGDCGMCSALVQFVLQHEATPEFVFVALQSKEGKQLSALYGVPDDLSTAAVIDGDVCMLRSDAILAVFRRLRYPWRLLGYFSWVPRSLRDAIYRFVAARRTVFGEPDHCVLPDPATRARFIDA